MAVWQNAFENSRGHCTSNVTDVTRSSPVVGWVGNLYYHPEFPGSDIRNTHFPGPLGPKQFFPRKFVKFGSVLFEGARALGHVAIRPLSRAVCTHVLNKNQSSIFCEIHEVCHRAMTSDSVL